jgi:hypothetical protein
MLGKRRNLNAVILNVGASCLFGEGRVKLIATGNPDMPVRSDHPDCVIEFTAYYATATYVIPDDNPTKSGTSYTVWITKCPSEPHKIVVMQRDRILLVHGNQPDHENWELECEAPRPSQIIPARVTPKKVHSQTTKQRHLAKR